jgi:flagellar hook-length control protein FliK
MERKIVAVPNAMAPERASTENQAIVTIVPRDGVDPRQALMPGTRPNEKTPTALHVVDPADSDATFEAPQPQAATRTTPVGSSALLAQLNAGESVEPVTTRSAPAMPPPTANAAAPRIETADTAAATNTRSTQLDSAPSMSSVTPAMPDPSALRPIVASDIPALRGMRGTIHPATAQVAVHVAKAANEGVERITIKLSPPELGRIDVKLDVGVDGRIQAVFAAERAATVDILQRDVRELERALQSAGLNTDAGSLSFSLRDHGQRGGFGSLFGSGREAAMPELDTDTTVESSPVPRHDAGSGRLDIRI